MVSVQEHVTRLCQLTDELVLRLELVGYEELEQFANVREELVTIITASSEQITEQDLIKLRKLGTYDENILSRMKQLRDEASQWLQKQGAISVQKSAYTNAFTTDGMFFDRRN
jgi:hypothetical protein